MAEAVVIPAPTRRLVLDLSQSEASQLKAMMQNPWYESESREIAKLREVIFNALQMDGVE